jgi:uroporphyrinogen III methyltransferase/synthase
MVDRTEINVHLVGAGPGDPGLITLRGIECLQQADVVIYDRLVNPFLLQYAPDAEWIDAGKQPDHHPLPQRKINALLVEKAQQGKNVVRLKGGDPFVFGRGGEEALSLANAGIPFEIVPGITSAIAAPAYAGIPVTHRNVSQSVSFITGHSAKEDNLSEEWACLAGSVGTLVFLMGVHNLPEITRQLLDGGRHPDTPVALIEQGTCVQQRTITGALKNIVEKAKEIQPPAIIIVGEVVRLRESLRWYDQPKTCPLLNLRIGVIQPFLHKNTYPIGRRPLSVGDHSASLEVFTRKLTLLGAVPVPIPTLRRMPTSDNDKIDRILFQLADSSLITFPDYWLLFSSTDAIDYFFEQLVRLNIDIRHLSKLKIFAIGETTRHRLKDYMLTPDVCITEQNDAPTCDQLMQLAGKHILYPHSTAASPELGNSLLKIKATVEDFPIDEVEYQPLTKATLEALEQGEIELLTFFSPADVHGLHRNLQEIATNEPIHAYLSNTTIACIDTATAHAAIKIGLTVDIVSPQANSDALISALLAWNQQHG